MNRVGWPPNMSNRTRTTWTHVNKIRRKKHPTVFYCKAALESGVKEVPEDAVMCWFGYKYGWCSLVLKIASSTFLFNKY